MSNMLWGSLVYVVAELYAVDHYYMQWVYVVAELYDVDHYYTQWVYVVCI